MNSRELGALAIRRVFVLLFFFYYLAQGLEHLEREAHHAADPEEIRRAAEEDTRARGGRQDD
jgi:hypothetical protein